MIPEVTIVDAESKYAFSRPLVYSPPAPSAHMRAFCMYPNHLPDCFSVIQGAESKVTSIEKEANLVKLSLEQMKNTVQDSSQEVECSPKLFPGPHSTNVSF